MLRKLSLLCLFSLSITFLITFSNPEQVFADEVSCSSTNECHQLGGAQWWYNTKDPLFGKKKCCKELSHDRGNWQPGYTEPE